MAAAGLAAEPSAVVSANRVVASSAPARAEGVARGLRRREAQARCPGLTVVGPDPGRDARAFEPVVAAVAAFAPRVEILRPGVVALATRGPSRYFGGDAALAARVAEAVAPALPAGAPACRVGVADGAFAASLAARRAVVVPPGGSARFLAPFPVTALDRPPLTDLLVRLGLSTLGAFAALPAADVLARFGADGAVAHRLARGLDERPLAGTEPPPDFAVQVELDPPAERVDTAAFAARALAGELHRALAERGLACTRVCIEAETDHGEHLSRRWRADGALTPGAIADRVRWQLDGWVNATSGAADRPTGGLSLLRLVPDEVVADDGRQQGFWGGASEADERAARALARVQGILGPEAVVTGVAGGGRHPAERVTLVPWGDARQPARPGDRPWPGRLPPPSPAVVFSPPLAAEVVNATGAAVGVTGRGAVTAEPARVSVDGARWAGVTGWAGPWPVDERWWDPAARRRRARFQVVAGEGAWLLAVEGGRWWAEASYD
ncbi:MAG: DNA polymerase Y family protein [Acidimicrobiia bacterium]